MVGQDGAADADQGNVDWQKEINDTVTPLESLRQLVAALEKVEAEEGVTVGEWVACIRTVQDGLEFPRVVTSNGSSLILCALSDVLAKDIASRAMIQWVSATVPQGGEGA